MKKTANTTTTNLEELKRKAEAEAIGGFTATEATYDLARALSAAVLKKVADPQRKAAPEREAVSDNGCSPAIAYLRRGVQADVALLDRTARAAEAATAISWTRDGRAVTETVDKAAAQALTDCMGETLTDGMDLVQAAALALVEWARWMEERGALVAGYLDSIVTARKPSRRVVYDPHDVPEMVEYDTSPVREVFRAVRREVEAARAPRDEGAFGYTYTPLDVEGADGILFRSVRYAGLAGECSHGTHSAAGLPPVATGSEWETKHMFELIDGMDLTHRQRDLLELRLAGASTQQIADRRGVTRQAVEHSLGRIRARALAAGLSPDTPRPSESESDDK